jgi:hypothetical protein
MVRAVLIGLLGLTFTPALAQAQAAPCTKTWADPALPSSAGGWNTPTKWSPEGLPGPTDVVCITGTSTEATHVDTNFTVAAVHSTRPVRVAGGELTLADPSETSTFSELRMGGSIHGSSDIRVAKLVWSSGTMDGPGGTTTVTERFETNGAASLSGGRQFITEGTGSLYGSVYGVGSVRWTNRAAITLLNGFIEGSDGGDGTVPVFHNEAGASVTKDTNAEDHGIYESWITFALDNDGVIARVDGPRVGRFWPMRGSGVSTGHFENLLLNGDQEEFRLGQGATLKKVYITGYVRLPEGGTTEMTDVTIVGRAITGRATLILKGHTNAIAGDLCGGGTTVIQPAGATLEWSQAIGIRCKRIETAGTVKIIGSGSGGQVGIWGQRTVWVNTGTIELVGGYLSVNPGDEAARLINRGLLLKTGGGGFEFRPRIVNDGVIDIQAGRLTATRLEQTPDSTLRLGLTGAGSYGALTVTELRHGGRLEATPLWGDTPPAANTRFNVITSSNRSGAFASTALSGLRLDESLSTTIGLVAPAAAEPAAPAAAAKAPAVATAPLLVPDRRVRLAGGRTFVLRAASGTRVRVVSHSRALSARVTKAGTLRLRRSRSARGTLWLRYRLIAADGRRSRIATITVR